MVTVSGMGRGSGRAVRSRPGLAVILAGGLGTRLRPVISSRPKALAPVNGRPFLAYLLDQIVEAGLQRAVICSGYLGEQIRDTFGDRYGPLALTYSWESEPLGTGGALRLALPLLDVDPVLVFNGDSYCDVDLSALWSWHRARRASATLVVTRARSVDRFGLVELNERGEVTRFAEKRSGNRTPSDAAPHATVATAADACRSTAGGSCWINAGIYVLARRLVESIRGGEAVSLEHDVFPSRVGHGLFAYTGGGRFLDIGTPQAYRIAPELLGRQDGRAAGDRRVAAPLFTSCRRSTVHVEGTHGC